MRYGALRAIASILRIVGWAIIVVCVVIALLLTSLMLVGVSVAGGDGGVFTGAMGAVIILAAGFLYAAIVGLPLLTLGEVIFLFLDIERNTRETAELLRGREG